MQEIAKRLSEIEDVRHSSYIKYKLGDVLAIILCGLDSLEDLHIFAKSHAEYWKEHLGMDNVPSRATLGRIMSLVDGDAVGKIMLEVMQQQLGISGNVVAVDGKAVRSTSKKMNRIPHCKS